MSRLLVITYANKSHWGLTNLEKTLKKNGFNYQIIGKGEKWEGFHTKMRAILKFTKTLSPHMIVCIIDAFDVLALGTPKELLTAFNEFKNQWGSEHPIVVGAECINIGLFPICENYYQYHNIDKSNIAYPYFNGGCVIGMAADVVTMYKWILLQQYTDDQVGIINYANEFPKRIILDSDRKIVANVTGFDSSGEMCRDRLHDQKTGTWPIFMHIPGTAWDFSYRMNRYGRKILGEDYQTMEATESIKSFFSESYKRIKNYLWLICVIIVAIALVITAIIRFYIQ